jgi:hypothetical protein
MKIGPPENMTRVGSVEERYQSYNIEMLEVTGGMFWKPYGQASNDRTGGGSGQIRASLPAWTPISMNTALRSIFRTASFGTRTGVCPRERHLGEHDVLRGLGPGAVVATLGLRRGAEPRSLEGCSRLRGGDRRQDRDVDGVPGFGTPPASGCPDRLKNSSIIRVPSAATSRRPNS